MVDKRGVLKVGFEKTSDNHMKVVDERGRRYRWYIEVAAKRGTEGAYILRQRIDI
jgi:hypothetical protein